MDVLETFFYLNIFFLTVFTWYYFSKGYVDQVIAYISVIITIAALLLIIFHHVYTMLINTSFFSNINLGRKVCKFYTDADPKSKLREPNNDDRELLDELNCPVYTGDYDAAIRPLLKPPTRTPGPETAGPTFSVVELHQPCLAAPHGTADPDGANAQNVS